jgi:hypothetical protein
MRHNHHVTAAVWMLGRNTAQEEAAFRAGKHKKKQKKKNKKKEKKQKKKTKTKTGGKNPRP